MRQVEYQKSFEYSAHTLYYSIYAFRVHRWMLEEKGEVGKKRSFFVCGVKCVSAHRVGFASVFERALY